MKYEEDGRDVGTRGIRKREGGKHRMCGTERIVGPPLPSSSAVSIATEHSNGHEERTNTND